MKCGFAEGSLGNDAIAGRSLRVSCFADRRRPAFAEATARECAGSTGSSFAFFLIVSRIRALKCEAEVGLALQKRIAKNEDKLFTFLHYDGVPWNNNNAEHAVRAFTRLRNVIGTSTPKGHRDYATLLSIQQTLHYRGGGLLDFLRSGRMEIA